MKYSSKTFEINGKVLTLETGLFAEQATGSVLGRMGDTMVLATVVMGRNDTTLDYFPLSVEYVERLYAGGRIKGSKWVKREGRPSDDAILCARLIDRSIRPLFPKALKKDVQVVVTVLSVDGENDPDVLSVIATSASLAISKIPWNGPIGATRIGVVETAEGSSEYVVNPNSSEHEFLNLDIVVSSVKGKTVMIEAEGKQASEETVAEAIIKAVEWNDKIESGINEMVKEVGEEKVSIKTDEALDSLKKLVEEKHKDEIYQIIEDGALKESFSELGDITKKIYEEKKEEGIEHKKIAEAVDYVFKKTIRHRILDENRRPDGRALDEVRPITVKAGILPRTHGSAIFQRGQTQVLTVATLGTSALEQLIESPEGEEAKRYMHHYSFPPYSVGETGRIGSPNRREIGHGALAEKALRPVIPPESKFPYVVRVVSEVMSSNGSTSQASVCGSTLALMDAGVPIHAPVAGIAIGLMSHPDNTEKDYILLTDIIGLEDFSGDMDFKVAGTRNGITAIQLDVKIAGLTGKQIKETLEKAKTGRLHILDKMMSVLPEARGEVSEYAPKIKVMKIPTEKIGEVIGSGGKVIRNIIATTGATVDIEEDGTVTVASVSDEAVEKAATWVDGLTRELQRGEKFTGKVKRLVSFGAFVEILPGKEGLVHVSEMSNEYVANPADVVQIGQEVTVMVKEIDEHGRINLTMKDELTDSAPRGAHGSREERGPRRDDNRSGRDSRNRRGSRSDRSFRKGPPRDEFPGRRSR